MTKKTLSTEDSTLFRQSIGIVKKIDSDNLLLTTDEKPKPYPKTQAEKEITNLQGDVNKKIEKPTQAKLSQEDSMEFIASGIQKNVLKKLRKGHFGLDASIDLHGLTSQQASQQLSRFLHYCIEDGYRCVHVIHGKGYRSPDNHPVLKNDINAWLRQYKEVMAFCSSPPKDGGTGALYVLLKLSEKYREQENPQY